MASLLLAVIYLSFISLGLPDALLGAAWPNMYREFNVPVSYAGIISMIIAFGTIISSLQSDRLTKKFGTGKVTAVSVGITALALWGFSVSHSFVLLCLWAIPYGLGAGSVDASLNNYVALHYAGKHMSWLHCMWGIGATLGPYIMGAVLTGGAVWNTGYRIISIIQIVLTAVLIFSLPKWKKQSASENENGDRKALSERDPFHPRSESSYGLFLLLLCNRTDDHALGEQLFESCERYRCGNCCYICRHVLHRNYSRARNKRIYSNETY